MLSELYFEVLISGGFPAKGQLSDKYTVCKRGYHSNCEKALLNNCKVVSKHYGLVWYLPLILHWAGCSASR